MRASFHRGSSQAPFAHLSLHLQRHQHWQESWLWQQQACDSIYATACDSIYITSPSASRWCPDTSSALDRGASDLVGAVDQTCRPHCLSNCEAQLAQLPPQPPQQESSADRPGALVCKVRTATGRCPGATRFSAQLVWRQAAAASVCRCSRWGAPLWARWRGTASWTG